MIFIIDNYDSFTYNLAQYVQELGREVVVKRNNVISVAEINDLNPEAVIISPGPGRPTEAGISLDVIKELGPRIPILGVCLGHQAIGAAYGAEIIRAERLMHGKTSKIHFNGSRLFNLMPRPFTACRYHSLIIDPDSVPDCLKVIGATESGEIMAVQHRDYPVYGVQFHPESILTQNGKQILSNFLELTENYRTDCRPQETFNPVEIFGMALKSEPMLMPVDQNPEPLRVYIKHLCAGSDLSRSEMETAMDIIMSGNATPAQIGAFLMALKMKGETVDEITGAAAVMRSKAVQLNVNHNGSPVIDTCGTGGDETGTYNISTTVAFILAGAGALVAKHGNRSVSSSCGSADVLQELGADLLSAPAMVEQCIQETGFGFLFAPSFHLAMKHAAGPRRELGVRTIFNVLGPLTNPAGAAYQLLGVYDAALTEPIAEALNGLGIKSAMVVHGLDGLDEISLCAPTKISRLKDGVVRTTIMDSSQLGLPQCELSDISGGTAKENAAHLRDVLKGKLGPRRDIALVNAAAALIVTEKANDFTEGIKLAAEIVDSGAALKKLTQFLEFRG